MRAHQLRGRECRVGEQEDRRDRYLVAAVEGLAVSVGGRVGEGGVESRAEGRAVGGGEC